VARARSRTSRRILEAVNAMCNLSHTEAGEEPIVFVEVDTRQDAGYTVSLEWDRGTHDTRIVLVDRRTACMVAFPVPGELAGDAFRHPFRYAP
jgi:hypothetical protein